MLRFLRAFLLASLLIGLGCGGKRGATGIAVDPAFTRLIPPDTEVLAGVRIDRLKDSAFYKRHEDQLNIPAIDEFSERAGIDPRRDLSGLLIAWNGKRPVVMARGRFAQDEVERKLSSLGARQSAYKKYVLFGTGQDSLVFVSKGVAVGGSPGTLHSVIDILDEKQGGVPDELEQRLAALPKEDQIWAVSRQGLPFADMPMRSDIRSALSNIVGFVSAASVAIGVDTGTHLDMEIACVSDQGAQRVRDALKGGIGLARLATNDNELDLLRLYDSIQVDQEQQVIHVRADLAGDLSDRLLARLPQIESRAGQALRKR